MDTLLSLDHIAASVAFSLIGISILAVTYFVVEKLTPASMTKELLEEHNTALAIVIGAVVLGVSIIVAAAIHG